MHLLEQYIKAILQEQIKSKTFSTEKLDTLSGPSAKYAYAKKHLKFLGRGTARAAFLLSSSHVLKLAHGLEGKYEAGLHQNATEAKISKDWSARPVVARVYDIAPDNSWIISQLVRPIVSDDDFLETLDMPLHDLKSDISSITNRKPGFPTKNYSKLGGKGRNEINVKVILDLITTVSNDKVEDKIASFGANISEKAKEFIWAARYVRDKYDLTAGDLAWLEHYGKTPEDRVVILDFGADYDLVSKYY